MTQNSLMPEALKAFGNSFYNSPLGGKHVKIPLDFIPWNPDRLAIPELSPDRRVIVILRNGTRTINRLDQIRWQTHTISKGKQSGIKLQTPGDVMAYKLAS